MVNNGTSGACHACKQRRKKCDESRPSCLRCTRAHRACPGYLIQKDTKFINYASQTPDSLFHPKVRPLNPTLSIEEQALAACFSAYCVVPADPNVSRGYLHKLQAMVLESGQTSDLTKACTTMGLVHLGTKNGDTRLLHVARRLHFAVLRSFRLNLASEAEFTSIEALITAALLGLYEILVATEIDDCAHIAHARGISAILSSNRLPFNLAGGGRLFELPGAPSAALPRKSTNLRLSRPHAAQAHKRKAGGEFSLLPTPSFGLHGITIDAVFAETKELVRRASFAFANGAAADEIRDIKAVAEELSEQYDAWPESLAGIWIPKCVGFIPAKDDDSMPPVGFYPGPILSYAEPYIATIWNATRKAHLLVHNILTTCASHLHLPSPTHTKHTTTHLLTGILSSIPYLLTPDLSVVLAHPYSSLTLPAGNPVGGLLLMHTLYSLTAMAIVEEDVKRYLRRCLAWIGEYMGIGQASVLAKTEGGEVFGYVLEAHVVIWTGMLI